jgi:putative oxygen-independent coproporphyrinogen III oxidase
MFNFTSQPPLTLYVHFPWCVRKCPYCDFNSHEVKAALNEDHYVQALIQDLEQDLPRIWGRRVVSVFMGGGAPSLFSPESIERLLSAVRARVSLHPEAEVTLEANPGTVDYEKFAEFRSAGVNRLSIGVQSFHDDHLQAIGRIHGGKESIKAVEIAHDAGFENFNVDLMFGLPGQTPKQALQDVATAVALEPTHISFYQLTIEPNTWFYHHPPVLPDDDRLWQMQTDGQRYLAEYGFAQYEVSAYAKADKRCVHNLNYWQFGDYLGIGAGAHAKLTDVNAQSIYRLSKLKQPQDYQHHAGTTQGIQSEKALSRKDVGLEFMMNAFRLNEGFATPLFFERTGQPLSVVEAPLRRAQEQELIEWTVERIRPTEKGRRYLNALLEMFLPD